MKKDMTMRHLNQILAMVVAVVLCTACKYDAPSEESCFVKEGDAAEWQATMSIEKLLEKLTVLGDAEKYPPRSASYAGRSRSKENWGLFSVQDITDSIIMNCLLRKKNRIVISP